MPAVTIIKLPIRALNAELEAAERSLEARGVRKAAEPVGVRAAMRAKLVRARAVPGKAERVERQ